MSRFLIDKIKLNTKLNRINEIEEKKLRHKRIQDQFKKEYLAYQPKKTKKVTVLAKKKEINNHYETLKAIAKVVGVNLK